MPTNQTSSDTPLNFHKLSFQTIFIGIVLGFPFGMATSAKIFRDGDVSWQIAAGQWILRKAEIPTTDPFSFTVAGHPWVAMEWVAEIVYALAFRFAGYAGLAAVVAAALIALNAIIFFYLQRRTSASVVAVALIMMNLVLGPFMLARPHVLAWPLLAWWTIILLKNSQLRRAPPLWTPGILVLWTNLHASFPLAVVIAAAIGLDTLIETRWTTTREWVKFSIACLVALSLNANGLAGLLQPFKTSTLTMLPLIGEWQPSTTHTTPLFFGVLLLALAALLWIGVRVPIGRLILLMLMLGLAFSHVRHQSSFIIVAACVVPPLLERRPSPNLVPRWLILGAIPLLVFRSLWPLVPPESQANPRSLLAAVPPQLRSEPVFNGYTFGGPLILAGIRPYIDGRAEIYGDAFVANYVKIANGDVAAFNGAVERYGISWAMIPNSDRLLINEIESSGAWRRIYADHIGVIDVRNHPDLTDSSINHAASK